MGTAEINYEMVHNQVMKLGILVDEFAGLVHPALLTTREQQDGSRWTDLRECGTFRSQYRAAIDLADVELRAVWGDVEGLAYNLQAAAKGHSDLDQEVADLLTRIADKRPTGLAEYVPAYQGATMGSWVQATGSGSYLPGSGQYVTEGGYASGSETPTTTGEAAVSDAGGN